MTNTWTCEICREVFIGTLKDHEEPICSECLDEDEDFFGDGYYACENFCCPCCGCSCYDDDELEHWG